MSNPQRECIHLCIIKQQIMHIRNIPFSPNFGRSFHLFLLFLDNPIKSHQLFESFNSTLKNLERRERSVVVFSVIITYL